MKPVRAADKQLEREALTLALAERPPSAPSLTPGVIMSIGLAVTALYVGGLLYLMTRSTYDYWGGMVIAPVLFAASLPILARQARREADPKLFWFLAGAVFIKLLATVARYWVSYFFYAKADAREYDTNGAAIAHSFLAGNFHTSLPNLTGSNFISFVTGIVYTVIRPTLVGGFMVFSWLGFWGMFLFYRAFRLAVPEGRARTYRWLLFFIPSLLFWPSSLGKESWMILAFGIAAYGAALLFTGGPIRGLIYAVGGIYLAELVRPHDAGIMAIAMAIAYLIKRPSEHLRQLAPVVKVVGVVIVIAAAVFLLGRTQQFLEQSGFQTTGGVSGELQQNIDLTSGGGSAFTPTLATTPQGFAIATVTVLFRPLPFEAGNLQTAATALEGTFLLLFTILHLKWILAAAQSIRRQPFVAFVFAVTVGFIIAYSSLANFGILARQRVVFFPLLFVILSIPPKKKAASELAHADSTESTLSVPSRALGPPAQ